MKRKSLFVRGESLLKWHAVIYIGFTVALWATLAVALDGVNFEINKDLILSRMQVTIFWGLVFLAHFAFRQFHTWRQDRARQSHLDVVATIQDRYVPSARLDFEAQAEDSVLIDEDEWPIQQHIQSK